ncbi:hypothetical protein [Motilimonas sp. KMU-193]|uniref:hypothetical protein n=1 Tax=Motilimonas sp. KMU-193 TaxID=3388668 RepID=UPI00396B0221
MKQIIIVAACVALFNPASLLYAQCYLVASLLNSNQSPLEIVRQQPAKTPLQANLQNADALNYVEIMDTKLELK